jgi:replicative DNA helicase
MTPLEKNEANEKFLLIYAYTDGAVIDRATQAGVTAGHFLKPEHYHQWQFLCELRLRGLGTDGGTVIQEAIAAGRIDAMGGVPHVFQCSEIGNASPGGAGPCIERILDVHAKRQAYKLLLGAVEHLTDGGGELSTVRETVERVAGICAGNGSVSRGIPEIADEAIKDAEEQIKGEKASRTLIYTGLPMFDKYATPMEAWDYVVVGGRTSAGKSSLMIQIAGHNLSRGIRVAIFSLETSDSVVLKQMVAQRAGINLRNLGLEMPAKQQEYMEKLKFARGCKDLMIFDRDTTLKAIQARCRLLATSFKPQLVIIDYLNIIGHDGDAYERTSRVSTAMIELRKQLGCCLMVGAQLSRSSEKEEREPTRTDYKDSGSIEQDASRLLAVWRKPGQAIDLDNYDCALFQLKNRTGPLARVDCKFRATTTTFMETVR